MSKTLFIVIMMKQVRRFVGDVNGFVPMTCGKLCLNLRSLLYMAGDCAGAGDISHHPAQAQGRRKRRTVT